jgi:DNA gyrase subunit A
MIERFKLSDIQARAIVEMLRQLTGLEQDKLRTEYEEIMKVIERLRALLADVNLRVALIKEELIEIRENTEMSVVQ